MEEQASYGSVRAKLLLGKSKVVLLNTRDSAAINHVIEENIVEIKKLLYDCFTDFIYLPELDIRKDIYSSELNSFFNYNYPFIVNEERGKYAFDTYDFYEQSAKQLNISKEKLPCFVYLDCYGDTHILNIDKKILNSSIAKTLIDFIKNSKLRNERPMYCRKNPKLSKEEKRAYRFDDEIEKLSNEVLSKIKDLEEPNALKFFMEVMNQRILEDTGKSIISRLYVDSEYQIYLTDYNNMKIELTPLQRTVYFLFLNHPEGIFCSDFCDYQDEIRCIYKELSKRMIWDDVVLSIESLARPYSSSMSEKISKIRNEFLKNIAPHLAKNYFIWGERRERKRITIDRQLVIFEKKPSFLNSNVIKHSMESIKV